MRKKNYTVVFQNRKGVTDHVIITGRSERKARKTFHDLYENSNILSISEKRDSSLPQDDDWA